MIINPHIHLPAWMGGDWCSEYNGKATEESTHGNTSGVSAERKLSKVIEDSFNDAPAFFDLGAFPNKSIDDQDGRRS